MPIGITEEHEALRQSARRWLESRCPPAVPLDADAPVLGSVLARLVLLPVDDGWGVFDVEAGEVDVAPLPSLDPTRRVGSVRVRRDPDRVLRGVSRDRAHVLAAVMVAAECAGGAGWCLDTTSANAKVREQFGRPIGQFQAVKH